MNRGGGFHSFNLVQQMMEGSTPAAWWSMHNNNSNNMRLHPPELIFPLLPPPSSSSATTTTTTTTTTTSSFSAFAQSPQPNSNPEIALWAAQDHSQDLPESWCQLLLGGIAGEDQEKYDGLNPAYQMKKMENCVDHQHDQLLLYNNNNNNLKQELYGGRRRSGYNDQEIQVSNKSPWSHQQIPASSPRSCITSSSFSTNMLDFSNKPIHHQPDNNSSECNSTETAAAPAFKKSRVQGSSSPKSTLKVRKEKLGDRITALHQLVSPFGKTDTASVLQEAIGYIRFLQGQIEALSSPYLQQQQQQQQQAATASAGNIRRHQHQQQQHFSNESGIKSSSSSTAQVQDDVLKKDLRSRGLCLVPVSFTMHVGGDNGVDFWAPALGRGF